MFSSNYLYAFNWEPLHDVNVRIVLEKLVLV